MHLLYICTGNSCRSVMAEYYTRYRIQQAGMDTLTVESAGVFALDGMRASEHTQNMLKALGIDCSMHRARNFNEDMGLRADKIFVMEQFHGEEIVKRLPLLAGKLFLLRNYCLGADDNVVDPNIADPVGKPVEVYESCFAEIKEAVERVLASLGVKGS